MRSSPWTAARVRSCCNRMTLSGVIYDSSLAWLQFISNKFSFTLNHVTQLGDCLWKTFCIMCQDNCIILKHLTHQPLWLGLSSHQQLSHVCLQSWVSRKFAELHMGSSSPRNNNKKNHNRPASHGLLAHRRQRHGRRSGKTGKYFQREQRESARTTCGWKSRPNTCKSDYLVENWEKNCKEINGGIRWLCGNWWKEKRA